MSNGDASSCGDRCSPCPTVPHATATCDGAACGYLCLAGFADCDGNSDNGCEADFSTPATCGTCSNRCSGGAPLCQLLPAGASCVSGCNGPTPTRCGSSCVDLTRDPNHCGDCATECPSPANGAATCTRGECGLSCVAGYHVCGTTCALDASVATCGSSCTPCVPPANAASTCDGSVCSFTCNAGHHLCGGACVSDASVSSCGSSCSPCAPPSNATATCAGGACGFICGAGYHACGGACASDVSVATCGTSCVPCSLPANATATCAGGACGFVCNASHHRCGDACVSDSSVSSCGASCGPCAAPANAVATCDGTACGFTCNAGFHQCGGVCASDSSTSSCGASCSPCPTPAHAAASCAGGACGFVCDAGYRDCNATAVDGCEAGTATSLTNCGACGTVCAAPANATATCASGACGYACNVGYVAVGGACVIPTTDGVVDDTSLARGVTLLRDPVTGSLVIVYQDTNDSTRNDIRLARFAGAWSTSTLYSGAVVVKQGAGIDTGGRLHLAIRQTGLGGVFYASNRSGAWASPTLIPGMPTGSPTLDVDAANAVHVTSNNHLSTRYYTHNASGSWLASPVTVAGSSTGAASILAAGLANPAMLYSDWSGHTIYFSQGGSWGGQATLYRYGVDQGPPLSLQAFGGAFHAAYVVTTDSYVRYTVFYHSRPAGGSWSSATPLLSNFPAFAALELTIDEAGTPFVVSCDNAGTARVNVNRGGAWVTSTLAVPYCAGEMDATAFGGRLYLAYRGTGGRLTVATVSTSTL